MIESTNRLSTAPKNGLGQEIRGKNILKTDKQTIYQPKVMMYHRIVEDKRLSRQQDTCLHINDFENQLKLLTQLGYTPITFRDYQLFLKGELRLPKKPVILTFDDGYESTYRLAYPLLKEQGMKAVIFVLGDRSIRFNQWDADIPGVADVPLMNDEQIIELHSNGFEIGAHTLSHPDLTKMNQEACYREIYKSKLILEALLDSQIISFCYPYGLANKEVKTQVAQAGYQFACSVFSGPAEFGSDHFEVRRIAIHNSTTLGGFMLRLIAPYEYLEWMWWKTNHELNDWRG